MHTLGKRLFRHKRRTESEDDCGNGGEAAPCDGILGSQSAGISVVESEECVFWVNGSVSLPARLSPEEMSAVQESLERAFPGKTVRYSEFLR